MLQDMILACVQDKVDFTVELFPHDDHREMAVMCKDSREILFSSDSISGIGFARAYANWCDEHGFIPF